MENKDTVFGFEKDDIKFFLTCLSVLAVNAILVFGVYL